MAARLFTVDLDLNLNKAKRFVFEDFNTTQTGTAGRVIYWTASDSSANHLKLYNGTAWKTIAFTDDIPDLSSVYQPLDADLTAIAALTGTSGFLKTDGANGWSVDTTTYATAGDISNAVGDYIPLTQKGDPQGVAELDIDGYVPAEQLNLTDYVTLTGIETLSNKTISDDLKLEGSLLFDVISETPTASISINNGPGYDQLSINSSDWLNLNASGNTTINGNYVGIDSFTTVVISGSDGEFLNSSLDPENQIATVGTTQTFTNKSFSDAINLISSDELDGNGYISYGPYTANSISYSPTLRIESLANSTSGSGRLSIEAVDKIVLKSATSGLDISTSGSIVMNSGFAQGGGEYLGSVSAGNQIATVGDIEALDAYDITATQISNWDNAYSWGDHSNAGYLKTAVESISNVDGNITFSSSTGTVTADLSTNIEIDGTLTFNAVNPDLIANTTGSASIFDSNLGSISIGSGVDVIDIGSSTGTVTLGNDLIVTGDLTVNGDVTTLNTATMNVEDNIFVLNSNVTGTPSVNAGLEVERGDYTNASIYWKESSNIWAVFTPQDAPATGAEHAIARKYVTTTTGTTHTIQHGLNTSDVTVNCWLSGEQVEAAIVVTDANTVTVTTNSSITNLKTVVVG